MWGQLVWSSTLRGPHHTQTKPVTETLTHRAGKTKSPVAELVVVQVAAPPDGEPVSDGELKAKQGDETSVGSVCCSLPVNSSSLVISHSLSIRTVIKWDYITAARGVLSVQ